MIEINVTLTVEETPGTPYLASVLMKCETPTGKVIMSKASGLGRQRHRAFAGMIEKLKGEGFLASVLKETLVHVETASPDPSEDLVDFLSATPEQLVEIAREQGALPPLADEPEPPAEEAEEFPSAIDPEAAKRSASAKKAAATRKRNAAKKKAAKG